MMGQLNSANVWEIIALYQLAINFPPDIWKDTKVIG